MNHRERMLAAIRHEAPDRIPIDAIHIENTDAIGRLLQIPADAVLDHLGIDGRSIAAGRYTGALPLRAGKELSPWGTEDGNDYGTTHFYPLAAASTAAEVERYAWPDPALYDFDELSPRWTAGPASMPLGALIGSPRLCSARPAT